MSERAVIRKVKGGKLVRVKVKSKCGLIEDVKITGDFFAHPEEGLEEMERELRGTSIGKVRAVLESATGGITLIGMSREDLVEMIEECLE